MLADELLRPLIPDGSAADPRIIKAFGAINRPDKIITIMTPYVHTHPNEPWGYFMLAAAYYASGDDNSTIAILQSLAKFVPSSGPEVTGLIQGIQNASESRTDTLTEIIKLIGSTQ